MVRLEASLSPRPPQRGLCSSTRNAAMRLRLSNPDLVPDLIGFLESRVDMVAERVSENELEMSLLGSYNREARQLTLDLLLRAWEADRNAEAVVLLD
jgi:hypothetical protein